MRKKILIVTYTGDNSCIETVTNAIKKNGGEVVRLDVDRFPLDYKVSSSFENGSWELLLNDGDTTHNLSTEFCGLWNRRFFHLGECLTDAVAPEYLQASIGESNTSLVGLITHLEYKLFSLNSYSMNRRSSIKEDQLRVAAELGMRIPDTCITNDTERAKLFIKKHPNGVVTKMQHPFSVIKEGVENVVYTNEVSEDDFGKMEGLGLCPMKFQEKIEKQLELRITIVGEEVFSAALDSQVNEGGKVDWRKVGLETVKNWVPCEIPDDLKEKLLALHRFFNLNYGAADVILTPENEYVFLETNPGGEFFWLDRLIDFKISNQIAKVLMGIVPSVPHHSIPAIVDKVLL